MREQLKRPYNLDPLNDAIIQNKLQVDHWITEHEENKMTGEDDLIESFGGKIDIKQTEEYTYLGFVISYKGDNMANIRVMKKSSEIYQTNSTN